MHMHTHGGGCFSSFEQLKACHEEKLQIPEAEGLGVGPAARATHDLASSLAPLRPAPLPVGRAPGLAHGAWLASDTGGDAGHARPCHSPPGGEGGCARCGWAPGPPGDCVPAARSARPRAAPAHPELCPPVSEPLPTPRRAAQGPGSPSARRGHRTAAGRAAPLRGRPRAGSRVTGSARQGGGCCRGARAASREHLLSA